MDGDETKKHRNREWKSLCTSSLCKLSEILFDLKGGSFLYFFMCVKRICRVDLFFDRSVSLLVVIRLYVLFPCKTKGG